MTKPGRPDSRTWQRAQSNGRHHLTSGKIAHGDGRCAPDSPVNVFSRALMSMRRLMFDYCGFLCRHHLDLFILHNQLPSGSDSHPHPHPHSHPFRFLKTLSEPDSAPAVAVRSIVHRNVQKCMASRMQLSIIRPTSQ